MILTFIRVFVTLLNSTELNSLLDKNIYYFLLGQQILCDVFIVLLLRRMILFLDFKCAMDSRK